MKVQYLSYPLQRSIPVYGNPKVNIPIEKIKSIEEGDCANVFSFTIENHWGTHVDCPNHFFLNGSKITDYPADFWNFSNPQIIEVDLDKGELLKTNQLQSKVKSNTDLLLLKSGWSKIRNNKKYAIENPGIHPEVGFFIRNIYTSIRAIGIDWISVSSYMNREIGREAHKAFLNPNASGRPILIIEDMDLSADLSTLNNVWALPLRVEEIDSTHITVIGIFE